MRVVTNRYPGAHGLDSARQSCIVFGALLMAMPFLVACAASTSISSRKDTDVTETLVNVAVVSFVERALGAEFARAFERKVRGRLAERVTKIVVITVDDLGLEPDEFRRRVQENRPDHVIDIRPRRDVRDGYGNLRSVEFDVGVRRTYATRLLWRASVEFNPGARVRSVEERADVLAHDIVERLAEDGLL
jgi:hypothetical protein